MSAKTDEILESLKKLSLLEASELVKQIEDAFGVSAAASAGGKDKGKKTANEKALAKLGHAASKSSEAGNFGSRYIIIFVPVGNSAITSGASAAAGGVGSGSQPN